MHSPYKKNTTSQYTGKRCSKFRMDCILLKTHSGYIPLLLTCAFSDPMDNCVPTDVDFNRALCIPTECIPTGEFVWVPVDIL